jgi:hypothetical protein
VEIELESVERLRFADGSAVRAASAVERLGDGFLVVQDDATRAAWFRQGVATEVRLLPPVAGLDRFRDSEGTKHLKPDLEASCALVADGEPAVLVLGSGSSPARKRGSLLRLRGGEPQVAVADLAPLYAAVATALGVDLDVLNLEGACLVDGTFRWFHRGLPSAGLPSGSVDLDPGQMVAVAAGRLDADAVGVGNPCAYDLGSVDGVGLAVTDVVTLPDGSMLASAVAEASPNVRDDGPVVASALVHLDGHEVREVAPLPPVEGRVSKVEGLMVAAAEPGPVLLRAVVDADDADAPSLCLRLRVRT